MQFYTTAEAAKILGIQAQTVTRHIERGTIQAEKRGRDYFITQDEIERFKQARRKAGRPAKK